MDRSVDKSGDSDSQAAALSSIKIPAVTPAGAAESTAAAVSHSSSSMVRDSSCAEQKSACSTRAPKSWLPNVASSPVRSDSSSDVVTLKRLRHLARKSDNLYRTAPHLLSAFGVSLPLGKMVDEVAAGLDDDPLHHQTIQHQYTEPWCLITKRAPKISEVQACLNRLNATGAWRPEKRDACGATVLHIAVLNGHVDLSTHLMNKYGDALVLLPYCISEQDFIDDDLLIGGRLDTEDQDGMLAGSLCPYEGESVLHMAIEKWADALDAVDRGTHATPDSLEVLKLQAHKWRDFVKTLVSDPAFRPLLTMRATGEFFDRKGNCYFGELPVLWAVSMGKEEILDTLLDSPNARAEQVQPFVDLLMAKDSAYGSSPWHMAVHHSQPGMFHHLIRRWERGEPSTSWGDQHDQLVDLDGHTALTLAAYDNNVKMFKFILRDTWRSTAWSFWKVTCYSLRLDGLDTYVPEDPGGKGSHLRRPRFLSALAVAVHRGNSDILQEEYMKQLLKLKWEKCAKYHFYFTFGVFSVMMVVLTALVARVGGSCHVTASTWALEATLLLLAFAFFAQQALDLCRYQSNVRQLAHYLHSLRAHPEQWGFAPLSGCPQQGCSTTDKGRQSMRLRRLRFRNDLTSSLKWENATTLMLHLCHTCCLVLIVVRSAVLLPLYLSSPDLCRPSEMDEQWFSAAHQMLGFAAIFGWVYALYFARGWQTLGHLVVTIGLMLFRDVLGFAAIYMVISMGYALLIAVYIRLSDEDCMAGGRCWSIGESWMSLFAYTMGDLSAAADIPDDYGLWQAVYLSFTVLSNVLMLNLLIALMNNTYAYVDKKAARIWLRQWANFILLAERRLPASSQRSLQIGTSTMTTRRKHRLVSAILREPLPSDEERAVQQLMAQFNLSRQELEDLLKQPDSHHMVHQVVSTDRSAPEFQEDSPAMQSIAFSDPSSHIAPAPTDKKMRRAVKRVALLNRLTSRKGTQL